MKTENKYYGQSFPMWFQAKRDGNSFILGIAHDEDVMGLKIDTKTEQMKTVKVVEILETRDHPKNGKVNHFHPDAKFYTVKTVCVV